MGYDAIAEQALIENQILRHVKEALRISLGWKVGNVDLARKLSSVGFTTSSLARHLERVMALEEDGGYMEIVRELKPNLYSQVETLQAEHERFRRSIRAIMPQFDEITAASAEHFERLCGEVTNLLDELDSHERRETDLLQDVFLTDEGGEG